MRYQKLRWTLKSFWIRMLSLYWSFDQISNLSSHDVAMCYGIVQVQILRVNCLVTAFCMLVRFCKALKPEVLLIDVFNLSCNYIDSLVVVFVDWGNFFISLIHRCKLLHGRSLIYYRRFSKIKTRFHQILFVPNGSCLYDTIITM